MKVDVMTEVFEILKKGQGTDTDIEALSNKEKFLIISVLKRSIQFCLCLSICRCQKAAIIMSNKLIKKRTNTRLSELC